MEEIYQKKSQLEQSPQLVVARPASEDGATITVMSRLHCKAHFAEAGLLCESLKVFSQYNGLPSRFAPQKVGSIERQTQEHWVLDARCQAIL